MRSQEGLSSKIFHFAFDISPSAERLWFCTMVETCLPWIVCKVSHKTTWQLHFPRQNHPTFMWTHHCSSRNRARSQNLMQVWNFVSAVVFFKHVQKSCRLSSYFWISRLLSVVLFPHLQSYSNDPWTLLKLAHSADPQIRVLGVNALAQQHHWHGMHILKSISFFLSCTESSPTLCLPHFCMSIQIQSTWALHKPVTGEQLLVWLDVRKLMLDSYALLLALQNQLKWVCFGELVPCWKKCT